MSQTGIELSIDGESKLYQPLLNLVEHSETLDSLNALVARLNIPPDKWHGEVSKKLKVGAPFKVTIGNRDLEGDITRLSFRRSKDAALEITVFGLEKLHRLRNQRISTVLEQARDKIAETLIKESSASAKSQAVSATAEEVVFIGDNMLAALKKLARERNFAIYYDGKAVNFVPRSTSSGAALKLTWGYQVEEGSLNVDLVDVVTGVKIIGRDYTKGPDVVEYESKESDLSKISGGDTGVAIRKKAFGDTKVIIPEQVHSADMSEIKERAIGEMQHRAEGFVTGSVRCLFQYEAAPGGTLEIENAGWPYQGPWMISAVTNTRSARDGLSTTIEFFSDSLPKP